MIATAVDGIEPSVLPISLAYAKRVAIKRKNRAFGSTSSRFFLCRGRRSEAALRDVSEHGVARVEDALAEFHESAAGSCHAVALHRARRAVQQVRRVLFSHHERQ